MDMVRDEKSFDKSLHSEDNMWSISHALPAGADLLLLACVCGLF